ncbi:MAG: 30S ribosomal protein S17 [Candidatus Pacebacteria bacterium]|nr:30S ribosomal protein S17 [Candidatus Paceibacterota bacterium]
MTKDNKEQVNKKGKIGIVISNKMDKTVVVKVERLKVHAKYKKKYRVSKSYKAHDEENILQEGDKVVLTETKPISKDKKWIAEKR